MTLALLYALSRSSVDRISRLSARCILAALMPFVVATASGQEVSNHLPASGTITYRMLLHGDDLEPNLRFSGRAAVRLHANLYLGFAVGSWATYDLLSVTEAGPVVSKDLQAVEYLGYVQYYVVGPAFVRAAGGAATTRTTSPLTSVGLLSIRTSVHPALGAGAGVDLTLGDGLAVTLALDFTRLLGTSGPPNELDQALSVGLGLTIR